ncbi:MAG: zinc ribbon domain-containing protein [Pseudomonadota bacterium]
MPIYGYECQACGVFEAPAPMKAYADPCDCPTCGKSSPRVLNAVPFISTMSSSARKAHAVNERSADNPKRMSTHGPVGMDGIRRNQRAVKAPDGSKAFVGARPWMMSY